MDEKLSLIEPFILEHHLLTLATHAQRLWCCSMFYAYSASDVSFIVASDPETEHMQNVTISATVAGTVALETKTVGKIRGIQFSGEMQRIETAQERNLYFKRFPYALAMNPVLWSIRIDEIKMTDNTLGFGKKLTWKRDS